jgi:DNA-binding NarL/FixJ family response regulator
MNKEVTPFGEGISVVYPTRIRVLLVDDHAMLRQALRLLLESCPDLDVVGEAGDGEEALEQLGLLQPTVIVMDINMPKLNGIAATWLVKHHHPHIAVVGLTLNAQSYQAEAMLRAGAVEVLTKEKAGDDLYHSIKKAIPTAAA